MQKVRQISSDEMVGEFLKAELHSSRFRDGSLKALQMLGLEESLLETPNYTNKHANEQRAHVLHLTRGWPDEWLFSDFPTDSQWSLYELTIDELATCYRLKSTPSMSDNERRLANTADRVARNDKVRNIDNSLVRHISQRIEAGQPMPPIIIVSQDVNEKKVLIEGHSRSVAYCVSDYQGVIPAIIGFSQNMKQWAYF